MKKIYVLILILATLQFVSCQNGADSKTAADQIKIIELKVEGMTCEGCEKTLEKAIQTNKGVLSVSASADSALVILKVNQDQVDIKQILQSIVNKGYEAEEIKPKQE